MSDVITIGEITIDPGKHIATRGLEKLNLLPKEFALLEFFFRHPDHVFSLEALLERVWQSDSEVTTEAVRSTLKRLRKKVDGEVQNPLFKTVHGVGFMLVSPS